MLKSKVQTAEVGDVIRALDFNGNFTCYMIGLVLETKGDTIRCRAISRVWEGKSERIDREFTTVQEGAHFMDASMPGRIMVI